MALLRGSALACACLLAALSGPVPAAAPAAANTARTPAPAVRPGLEVLLRDSLHLVRGKRVGLITNHTAITADGRSAIDVLHRHPQVRLVALYSPEHGLSGRVDGGERIGTGRHAPTGLPVFSLYGRTERPTPEMLRGIDVLLFDMQDIGARPYTYVWTMTMAMEEAARHRIPFVVLDRPNPITARVEGPLMALEMRNRGVPITGYWPVPLRHGFTAGELARYVNAEFRIGARLTVVPAEGWQGGRWFDETGLPWVNPSPNIRSLDAALAFSGLVMLETTNLSVGRGTATPFGYVGAPYVDAPELLRRVRAYRLPGVEFEPATFTPRGTEWMQFRNQLCRGVRLRITDREAFRPVLTALVFLVEIQKMHPRNLGMGPMLQMLGSSWAPAAVRRGDDPRDIERRWERELAQWRRTADRYRLYPSGE
ncbi:MAG TPA: DUF1343 domain-containing protein [Longimicrobiaceae bacterium]|nr:DUF1343 domain-containing protein [Longimicrobiaceae bacterium]